MADGCIARIVVAALIFCAPLAACQEGRRGIGGSPNAVEMSAASLDGSNRETARILISEALQAIDVDIATAAVDGEVARSGLRVRGGRATYFVEKENGVACVDVTSAYLSSLGASRFDIREGEGLGLDDFGVVTAGPSRARDIMINVASIPFFFRVVEEKAVRLDATDFASALDCESGEILGLEDHLGAAAEKAAQSESFDITGYRESNRDWTPTPPDMTKHMYDSLRMSGNDILFAVNDCRRDRQNCVYPPRGRSYGYHCGTSQPGGTSKRVSPSDHVCYLHDIHEKHGFNACSVRNAAYCSKGAPPIVGPAVYGTVLAIDYGVRNHLLWEAEHLGDKCKLAQHPYPQCK